MLSHVLWRAFPSVCASACPMAVVPLSRDCVGTVIGPSLGPPLSQIALDSEVAFVQFALNAVVWQGLK